MDHLQLILTALAAAAGYFLSCLWRPYRACRRCDGGKDHGWLFPKAWRPCHVCGGTGRRRRFGAWVMRRADRRVKGWRRAPRSR